MSGEAAELDGRIVLRGLLGEGGMGEVHCGWDRALERAVAVKFLRGSDRREAERLLLEGRLQARVEHPHVVQVYEAGTLGGRACLVLQLVEGRTLADLAPALPPADRVELVRQAAQGVHAAHLQGLVHRDVKPANVLVEQGPGALRALVSDFGLARGEEPGLTRSGILAGTLAFMSPEQVLGTGLAGPADDVYGLGATLYAVLAGRPPHQAGLDGAAGLRRLGGEPPPPLPDEVPAPLRLVVGKAMERDPGDRYPSAVAFAEDLARFQRGEPVSARAPTLAVRALAWSRRNRTAARALGVAVAAVLAAALWTALAERRSVLQAWEAARLGALGEAMEAQIRMEHLSPPHDLEPALARLRAQAEALRPEAARGGGPANFALGKGLQLLGDLPAARAAYERAWEAGFRVPRVAEGLGEVLAAEYRQAYRGAWDTLEPAVREERLAALRRELRQPAERYLALAGGEGWRAASIHASIALLEERYDEARARAAEALAADPQRYEALTLEAEAHLEEGNRLVVEGRHEEGMARLTRAGEILEEAQRWGQSDPEIALARASLALRRVSALAVMGRQPAEEVARARRALDRAEVLLHDDPRIPALRGDLLMHQASYAYLAAPAEVVGLAREAAALYRRAVAGDGGQARTLAALVRALFAEAMALKGHGPEAQAPLSEGLAAAQRAAAVAPRDPDVLRAQAWIHGAEAAVLSAQGKPAERALRQVVEAGEEYLHLELRGSALMRQDVGEALLALAQESWLAGRDPRPELERALAELEEAHRALPGHVALSTALLSAGASAAELLRDMGADPRDELAGTRVALDEASAGQPDTPGLRSAAGRHWAARALSLALAGEDPGPALLQARRLLAPAPGETGRDEAGEVTWAALPLSEARWDASHDRDPSGPLRQAEEALRAFLAGHPGAPGRAPLLLARCAAERAAWLRERGEAGRAAEAARGGLEALQGMAGRDLGAPESWALRARLSALAGDGVKAREWLERAYAANPLVRGGRDSLEAEAELSRRGAAPTGR
ncbi:MAG TPA: serine/threonine-protein kinase [Anaeromyxobacter sp.]|nr:serine/threonine-protein kinase [Anaeromyxobacter sp.]